MWNLRSPLIVPRATVPAVVTHGLAELPRVALMTNFSLLAVPPFMRGGTNRIVPVQTPWAGLHVTWPGWLTPFETADAAPDSNAMKRKDGNTNADRMRTIFRAIRAPVQISLLEGSREGRKQYVPGWGTEQATIRLGEDETHGATSMPLRNCELSVRAILVGMEFEMKARGSSEIEEAQ
jgi:hypothetical protein